MYTSLKIKSGERTPLAKKLAAEIIQQQRQEQNAI